MNEIKKLRGQLRQIAKDILPEVLQTELVASINKKVDDRLNHIDAFIRQKLETMHQEAKDAQSYVVRTLGVPVLTSDSPKEEAKP